MKQDDEFIRIADEKININLRNYNFHDDEFDKTGIENAGINGFLLHYKDELIIGDNYLLTITSANNGNKHLVKCLASVNNVEKKEDGFDISFKLKWLSRSDIDNLYSIIEH